MNISMSISTSKTEDATLDLAFNAKMALANTD